MAVITHSVGAEDVAAVRRSVLELYRLKADVLAHDVEAFVEGRGDADAIERHRVEMRGLGQLLDHLGWEGAGERGDAVVRGDATLLVESYCGALASAVDAVAARSGDADWPLDDLPGWTDRLARIHAFAVALGRLVADTMRQPA